MFLKKLIQVSGIIVSLLGVNMAQTIQQNILFTDMTGKRYDLFALLEQKKYVYILMMFNG